MCKYQFTAFSGFTERPLPLQRDAQYTRNTRCALDWKTKDSTGPAGVFAIFKAQRAAMAFRDLTA
jgi:hypothetical protein